MKFYLPLNQMMALVACGLCKYQFVMMFFGIVYLWLHHWFHVVVVMRLLALKKMVTISLLCVMIHKDLLSESCG
jgi:hypothetical protein